MKNNHLKFPRLLGGYFFIATIIIVTSKVKQIMYSTFVTSLHILANAFIGLRSDVTNRLKLPCILVSYCIKLELRCQP